MKKKFYYLLLIVFTCCGVSCQNGGPQKPATTEPIGQVTNTLDCLDSNACSEPLCQGYLAGIHQINDSIYFGLRQNLFGPNPPAPVAVAATSLDLNLLCSGHRIDVAYDEGNRTENDIAVTIKSGYAGALNKTFSIALFKGVTSMYQPDTYYFSKGLRGQNPICIVFFAKKNGIIKYYGNLSEAYPFVGKFVNN